MDLTKCNKCGMELDVNNMQCPHCGAINFNFDNSTNNEQLQPSSTPLETNLKKEETMENKELIHPIIEKQEELNSFNNFNGFNELANSSSSLNEEENTLSTITDNLNTNFIETENNNLNDGLNLNLFTS